MRFFSLISLALSVCMSHAAAATCPTASDVYKVYSTAAQPGAATNPSYVIRRVVLPLMMDDNILMLPLGVPDMIVGATSGAGNYFAQYVSSLPAAQVPAASTTAALGFKTAAVKTTSTGCPAVLFEKASASFMIQFNGDGSIAATQKLDGSSGGTDVGAYDATVADVNGDGLQDVVLKQNGVVRAVLTAQSNGSLAVDAVASATAVWNGFLAACAAGDRTSAVAYLTDDAAATFGVHLTNTANDITLMAKNIVGQQISILTQNKLMAVKVLYLNDADYVAYTNEIVSVGGAWYLQTL